MAGRSCSRAKLPEPYRFSSSSNKFTVFGCLAVTYMLGAAFEDDDTGNYKRRWYMAGCLADCRGNSSLKHRTNGSCIATIQGGEGLRYYYAMLENQVNYTDFNTTYPCAYALLMDSSYRFNFSTSYLLASNNEFNMSRVPVVLDWVIRNKTCRDAPTQPAGGAGYACVRDHSECVDSTRLRHGYRCQCAKGFQGDPYVKQGCKDQIAKDLHLISAIPKLTSKNYVTWREEIEVALALAEMDLALTESRPTKPAEPVKVDNETDDEFSRRKLDFAPIKAKYDLDKYKWEKSNRKCKIVIMQSITEDLRGAIPECDTAAEYLEKVKNQISGTLIQKLISFLKSNCLCCLPI